jgi:uncharacterized membrane protein YtjA (UPF0391 family)
MPRQSFTCRIALSIGDNNEASLPWVGIHPNLSKEFFMLSWALTFLIIALIAGVLGFSGIAGAAANIAWILFVVGLILAVIFFFAGRRPLS